MPLLVVRMFKKFSGHAFRMYSSGHEIMTFIPQDTNDFGRQRFVQEFYNSFAICAVTFGDSTIFDVLSRAFTQSLDVSEKWLISHRPHSLYYEFRGATILRQDHKIHKKDNPDNLQNPEILSSSYSTVSFP